MAVCFLLKEVVVFLCIIEVLKADGDLLETIHLDAANPPELNDFLQNVIDHKQLFSWIRHASRLADLAEQPTNPFSNDLQQPEYNKPGIFLKRNIRNRRPINDIHPYIYENDNLNEAPAVNVVRRKRKRRQRGYPRSRRSKGSVSLDLSNEPGNGEVKVAPRSEAGVVDVPGEKYVGKHGIKRTCEDEYDTHDRIQPRANNSFKSNGTTRHDSGEYYFTTPHDILGLDQDISKEYENLNGTCIQVKKSAIRRQDTSNLRSSSNPPSRISQNSSFTTAKTAIAQQRQIAPQTTNQFYQYPQQFQRAQAFQQPQQMQSSQMLRPQFVQQRQNMPLVEQAQIRSQLALQAQLAQNKSIMAAKTAFTDQKGQDFAKLIRYVDSPNMDVQAMSKQDLLRRDNDDVLENIDRVLKSDRTGLNLFRDVPYSPKRDESKEAANQNQNAASDGSKSSIKRSVARSKSVNGKRMDVEVILNALPLNQYKASGNKASPKRRKISMIGKKIKNSFGMHSKQFAFDNNDDKSQKIPIESFPKIDQQTSDAQQRMLADPNLKIMENADDENNDNLKLTLKEYINRQNEYNLGKQPVQQPEEEEVEVTPDFHLVQEKKNMLEDQTEPTSAAEQRELGKKDPYVTPSLLNDSEADNSLIVIPLKKNVNSNNMVTMNRNGEFDLAKEGFKVKESKDVIHVRTHSNSKGTVFKKETDQTGFDNSKFTKTVFNKVKQDVEEPSRAELGDQTDQKHLSAKYEDGLVDYQNVADYGNENLNKAQGDKLDPGKESADYDDYDNFDMKRDVSSVESDRYKSRKLNSINYEDGIYVAKVRKKRNLEDSESENSITKFDKRSEDDEPDEEPGNDAKEPIEHEKKIQKAPKNNKFSPKKEGGAMTLHMDQPGEIKRNDSENDFPPDDENDSLAAAAPSGDINRTGAPTVINYNYFNITVNMLSTTTAVCDINPSNGERDQGNDQTVDISNDTNERNEQIDQLAHDILRYTANVKGGKQQSANLKSHEKKIENSDDSETDKVSEDTNKLSDKKDSNIYPKPAEDSEQESKTSLFNDNGSMKKIFTDDDEVDERDVERSISEDKHDDDKDDEDKEREQMHSVRNAVDDAKHREMVVSKLEQLVNTYKAHVQHGTISEDSNIENIGKRSNAENNLHHYQHKKKVPQLPRPDCSAPMEKHVIKSDRVQFIKPHEVYYEPESMADDLKEKLLFTKVYNRVVRKRKKTPDPFMYKIIDSVFGSDEEADDDMCPVDLDYEGNEMEGPAKRTSKNDKENSQSKEGKELSERNTEYDDVSRQKKKTKTSEEVLVKDWEAKREDYHESPYIIKKQIKEDTKMKLDDVDSFKDVIEGANERGLRKREVSRKSLEDIPKSYLSPMDEGSGAERLRKRRRLKFLHKPQKKKIRQISYDDYVQQHGLGAKRLAEKQGAKNMANFNQGQNSNVKQPKQKPKLGASDNGTAPQALKKADSAMNTVSPSFVPKGAEYKIIEKNCTDLDNIKSNRSKMVECELKKKEHEDMRRMLNGFLPIKLIDTFYDKLKENLNLYNRFGGTIANSRQCASENAHNIKLFREEQAKVDIKHAEEMLHEVIIMLNQIVADQVHRRTCLQLAPNLRLFVIRITKNLRSMKKNYQVAEGYPLPKVKVRAGEEIPMLPPEEDQGDFLFGGPGDHKKADGGVQSDERAGIAKRIKLVEKLLEKYQSMSARCQVQVEPVKDYLLKHLNMLMKLMENTRQSTSTCATTVKDQEPFVREDELAPPRGNITIPKVVNIGGNQALKATTSSSGGTIVDNKAKLRPDSEVLQRQQVMLLKHQQEEEKQQQLQRQIHEQEMIRQMEEEQQQQEQLEQQPLSLSQDLYQQQQDLMNQPHIRDSIEQQNIPIVNNIPNNIEQPVQNIQNAEQNIPNIENRATPLQQVAPNNQQPSPTQCQNKPSPAAVSTTTNAIVQKQLEVQGKHFSSPEIVTKDLLSLGLDGANTYMPNFDVNGMVQEKVVKEMAATAGTRSSNTSPSPKTPAKPGPKKRDVFEQELSDDMLEDVTLMEKDSQRVNDMEEEIEKSITSRDSGRIMSKNQEMQDLMMTDLNPKPLFQHKRSLKMLGFIHQPSNASRLRFKAAPIKAPQETPLQTPPKPPLQTPNLEKSDCDPAKVDLSNYGTNQFLWQPLLIKATQIPDPDMEDTEYYSGRKYTNPELVQNDLVGVGLDGTISSYVMPFTLSSVVQGQIKAGPNAEPKFPVDKPANVLAKPREISDRSYYNVSQKYRRLLDTYHSLREKRQNEERIGKLYGAKTNDDIKRLSNEMHDISKVNFEKPIVFSLDG